jgi:hyperosmotically inducible protein
MRTLVAGVACGVILVVLAPQLLCADPDRAARPSPTRTADEWVTTQIQAQYFLDPDIKARTITVLTLNGIVTLEGDVKTAEEHARAAEIVGKVDGVNSVINHLTVGGWPQPSGTSGSVPGTSAPASESHATDQEREVPIGDSAIVADLRARMATDPGLSALDIEVQAQQGVVTLTGDVPDLSTRTRAERLARAVRGVSEVRNALSLKR